MGRPLQDIGLSVKRLQARHHRAIDTALAPLGIGLVQWDALRQIHAHPGVSLHDLAQMTFQTDQSFGALASRMIARDLIERVPGPGRAARHRLTEKGEALRQSATTTVEGVLRESFSPLSAAELDEFDALLGRLLSPPDALG